MEEDLTIEKAETLIRILENYLLKGELGILKKYTMADKSQTEYKIKELKEFIKNNCPKI